MIASPPRIRENTFGRTRDGEDVAGYTLQNGHGMSLEVLTYGAVVRTLHVADREGQLRDVVLGYDDLASYEDDRAYFGAVIGRYANRIRTGRFVLDGTTYYLALTDGRNHLHGGNRGFDKVVWKARPFEGSDTVGVVLNHTSPNGDEGYPGRLDVQITYGLSASNIFSVDYQATTDGPTPINLTQHSYFNLSGEGSGDVLGHELTIHAESFCEIDADLVPTGKLLPADGTPLDFRAASQIGSRIDDDYDQLRLARGYDHNFVLASGNRECSPAARARSPETGIVLDVSTTEPGIQFYSGNFLDGIRPGKNGHRYERRSGFCLETQHFPDSPNHPEFPSTILRSGDELRSRTEYRFTTQ